MIPRCTTHRVYHSDEPECDDTHHRRCRMATGLSWVFRLAVGVKVVMGGGTRVLCEELGWLTSICEVGLLPLIAIVRVLLPIPLLPPARERSDLDEPQTSIPNPNAISSPGHAPNCSLGGVYDVRWLEICIVGGH